MSAVDLIASLWDKAFKLEARADLADIQGRTADAHDLYRRAEKAREQARGLGIPVDRAQLGVKND